MELIKLDERFGYVRMSARLGVVIKALDPRRTKDGRDRDLVAAYFGFETEFEARRFQQWAEKTWPQGERFVPLTVVRVAQRTECGFEVKVSKFPALAELVRVAQEKEAARC